MRKFKSYKPEKEKKKIEWNSLRYSFNQGRERRNEDSNLEIVNEKMGLFVEAIPLV